VVRICDPSSSVSASAEFAVRDAMNGLTNRPLKAVMKLVRAASMADAASLENASGPVA
jgi:hypothetical protein